MSQSELRAALADDLDGLARLHDRETDETLIAALATVGFPDNFALLPDDEARDAMRTAFGHLQKNWGNATFADGVSCADALAADYAGIYLTGACGASPYESVWLSDEHLTCQLPMFELRALYEKAGLAVDDWRKRYDDHFVLQFQYLAHQLRDDAVPLENLGRFLDEHLAYWFADFTHAVVQRADTDFYRSLAVLTGNWLTRLRELIEDVSGEARTPREVMAERIKKKMALASGELAPIKFIPGGGPASGPSW
ncbi:MAG TPA: molecular chaperone TorD family protein [Rhodocyclaceae bacterium]|nr:molecular chaperone TorD family protein [Rhodocyclaceae bacterium]